MFSIGVQKVGCGKAAVVCDVEVDTLSEAEATALELATACFLDKDITLVYVEDIEENALIYNVYEDETSERIGRVGIKSL